MNTELFLNALVAMGLITKKDGTYYNTDIGQELLTSGKDFYMGDFLLAMTQSWYTIEAISKIADF